MHPNDKLQDFGQDIAGPDPSRFNHFKLEAKDERLIDQARTIGELVEQNRSLQQSAYQEIERRERAESRTNKLESRLEAKEEEYGDDVNRLQDTVDQYRAENDRLHKVIEKGKK